MALRMALGAQRLDVSRLILGRSLTLAVGGIGIGLIMALAASRLVAGMLYGVEQFDVTTYGTVTVGIAIVALIAAALPARRASHVPVAGVLRGD